MRQYLVSGYITFQRLTDWFPIKAIATLEDHEVMDHGTLAKVEAILLAENNSGDNTIAKAVHLHSFQPYEAAPPETQSSLTPEEQSLHHRWVDEVRSLRGAMDDLGIAVHPNGVIPSVTRLLRNQAELNAAIQLNECSVIMPPVDSPILIEIAPGVLLKASRPAHAEARGDQLVFNLETHGQFVGRPRWTHP